MRKFIKWLFILVLAASGTLAALWSMDWSRKYLVEHRIYFEKLDRLARYNLGLPLRGTPNLQRLDERLAEKGLKLGAPVFMRIFKEEHLLELWIKKGRQFHLFATYPICMFSGRIGPKLKEGDRQAPEGFYTVSKDQLNPNSRWYRSFNLGFPNKFDKSHGRTGSFLMVHGGCGSIGCYAMTNQAMKEIWKFVTAALDGGQALFHVHAYPFRMTKWNMTLHSANRWTPFWRNLKQGYDAFEKTRVPPVLDVCNRQYKVRQSTNMSAASSPITAHCSPRTATKETNSSADRPVLRSSLSDSAEISTREDAADPAPIEIMRPPLSFDPRVLIDRRERDLLYETDRTKPAKPDPALLGARLKAAGLKLGAPLFMRIFKDEHVLEVWVKKGKRFQRFASYPICAWSGVLGPKQKQGDRQAPEGFYTVSKGQLNPNSRYHRSFNLGYPNLFDRAHKRTGDYLMVHGDCVSDGCYAMTDPVIAEIWTLINKAFDRGQRRFHVHAYPFRMSDENMALYSDLEWTEFWRDLKKGYDLFEEAKIPPRVSVCNTRYQFRPDTRPNTARSQGSSRITKLCVAKTAENN